MLFPSGIKKRWYCDGTAQDPVLLSGTLRDNITLGRHCSGSSLVSWQVLATVQLNSWVKTLPDGLETPLGEQGASRLSGGTKQSY